MIPFRQADYTQPLLSVRGLSVYFKESEEAACQGVSFDVAANEIIGIVGESGSGKTVSCRALVGMLPGDASVLGTIQFQDSTIQLSDERKLAELRGCGMSMIFQDPMSALDPLMTVRRHLALRTREDPVQCLRQAGMAEPGSILDSHAHQLSGGQCQRVAIACALARKPRLLLADEPTTALDVTVQADILDQIRRLSTEQRMAVVLVTHDLAVINQLCSRVFVMHKGCVVEEGSTETVLSNPQHEYTRSLLSAIPRPAMRGHRLGLSRRDSGKSAVPHSDRDSGDSVLSFNSVSVRYQRGDGNTFTAANDVTLSLHHGEILGLVGESGSGKTTLAKTAVGLATPQAGSVLLGNDLLDWRRPKMSWRRDIQYIFQDPRGALDPVARVFKQVRLPLDIHHAGTKAERDLRARTVMAETQLEESLHPRKPGSLSGGQRQRATIARALALRPKVLICDESVSALDVSIQARVLNLLMDLRETYGIAILFISHDLRVVHHICDEIAVLKEGVLVEKGSTETLFVTPKHPYTQALLAAIPTLPSTYGVESVGGEAG